MKKTTYIMKLTASCKGPFPQISGLCVLLFMSATSVFSQSLENLNHLEGYKADTYFSTGSMEQAKIMANRLDRVMSFYKPLLDFEPTVTLLVLSPDDWSTYTRFPVYGMAHYTSAQTLIVASEDNDFWKSFIPPLDQLPVELAQKISGIYTDVDGSLTMRGFFDLLAIHELGHAFHIQGGLTMQRLWMGELFCNILLHTYIAEMEPELLSALTVFPQMVVSSTNRSDLKYTTLQELELNYNLIGQQHPNNYGWYQCRWHKAAGEIYDDGGIEAMNKLWLALKKHQEDMPDEEFVNMLRTEAHISVANVYVKWNNPD
ncbi:MAG: hypothetical protein KIT80_06755 [Chitinophagaceae bacterium]|nr:hypothetical protein [Chitinophagaceae bacterium]MCW5926597.1 hypothetical protein [Chitinophagaceae bacterium]